MRSGYNSTTLSYRIQTKPFHPIQYLLKTLWISCEFISKVSYKIMCLQKLCADTTCTCSVYTYELSSVQFHLFIFNLWKWRLETTLVRDNYRGINENLVKWCSCALLTQRTCFYKIFIWCFLRQINVITAYIMIFIDFYVVVVWNIIEKWVIYYYLLHIENCIFFIDIFCNISIESAHISVK